MSCRPERIVDAHVHLWDPARVDWYPYLSGRRDLGMGDVSRMSRRFDLAAYRAESAGWNVDKRVAVVAAVGLHSMDEAIELTQGGQVEAVIGGVVPTGSVAEAERCLDRQMTGPRFRGVRPMGQHDDPVPPRGVLAAIEERDLLFELMAHPDQLQQAADVLADFGDLTVVIEHTGWPRADTAEELALWEDGMARLADLGDRVVCKLSGLAMPLGSMSADAFAPWIERAIELFGVERAMFGSNFPVDGLHGTFDDLLSTVDAVTAGLDPGARHQLFAATAERVYRC